MNIDDKLKEILWSYEDNLHLQELIDEAAEKIKKAFADEGYLPHIDAGRHVKVGDKLYITNGVDPLVQVDLAGFMTGAEWYDRWVAEIKKANLTFDVHDSILEAAKKASK